MKILVTGGDGLVGSALRRLTKDYSEHEFVFTTRATHDLTKENDVLELFEETNPDYVIHTAARVGGIGRNLNSPAEQFYNNILMNTFVIHYAHIHDVKKLIAFSSVCAFPADEPIFKEKNLQNGLPYPAHGAYAYSKRMVDIQIEAYNKQYDLNYCSVIPANIFGEGDNYNLEDGHVVPSLIHKCYVAKQNNTALEVWGDGSPMREFLYSDDVARACIELLEKDKLPQKIIISGEHELEINQLVKKICNIFDYHDVKWLIDKPNGQLRRPCDKTIFNKVLDNFKFTNINKALENSITWFQENYPEVRK
jgi:GDP-L-fucose synthase